jgi:hypothetical protein
MSKGNVQSEWLSDLALHERTFTATGTVKTGRADSNDNGLIDNPVLITDPAANVTLTVPDGKQVGQVLFILFTSDASSKTVTITTTTGDDGSLTAAGDYAAFHWMGATSGWQKYDSQES